MNREDITDMLRESGIVAKDWINGAVLKFEDGYRYRSLGVSSNVKEMDLLQFATLVAAAEREECANEAEAQIPMYERFDDQRGAGNTARAIAKAIRARGNA